MAVADVSEPTQRLTHRGAARWVVLATIVVAAWIAVVSLGGHTHPSSALASVGAWLLMVVAMMLPTLVPMLRTLSSILAGRDSTAWWSFVGGYLTVWTSAGLAGVGLQQLAAPAVAAAPQLVTATVLALAGAYQLTRWKSACLNACTSPFHWFLRHWRDGSAGGWSMGIRHGLTCLGCCWALMALAVVATGLGVVGMAAMTAVMIVEKFPAFGRRVRVPIGVSLLAVAVSFAVMEGANHTRQHHHHLIGAHHGTLVADR